MIHLRPYEVRDTDQCTESYVTWYGVGWWKLFIIQLMKQTAAVWYSTASYINAFVLVLLWLLLLLITIVIIIIDIIFSHQRSRLDQLCDVLHWYDIICHTWMYIIVFFRKRARLVELLRKRRQLRLSQNWLKLLLMMLMASQQLQQKLCLSLIKSRHIVTLCLASCRRQPALRKFSLCQWISIVILHHLRLPSQPYLVITVMSKVCLHSIDVYHTIL